MSLIPSISSNQQSNIFYPFSLDLSDPFDGFPSTSAVANTPPSVCETNAITSTSMDWKETVEANMFKWTFLGWRRSDWRWRFHQSNKAEVPKQWGLEHKVRVVAGGHGRGGWGGSGEMGMGCKSEKMDMVIVLNTNKNCYTKLQFFNFLFFKTY